MKKAIYVFIFVFAASCFTFAQTEKNEQEASESTLTQYYSGKFGFYNPGSGLNNGLLLGVDGITQFNKLDFFLSGDIDFYMKKTIDIYNNPKPDISDQTIILIPIHVNFGYQLADIPDAATKLYAGLGLGYYLYFYSVNYSTAGGGIFPIPGNYSDNKNGGKLFFTIFGRVLIGKIFIEPRFYFAGASEGNTSGYTYKVNPSGFLITLGFQYGK